MSVAMVVGIVIGSGVFFKAAEVDEVTGYNLGIGVVAWLIGGAVMLICAAMFAIMATKYEKVGGVVDYAEETIGPKYAYMMGWFLPTFYYPTLTAVLAWVSAKYTLEMFNINEADGGLCMTLACFLLIAAFFINTLSPIIAGKIQVTTTVVKLIPLALVAIVGIVSGAFNGNISNNFSNPLIVAEGSGKLSLLLPAVVSTSFAYEGWIIATSINAEIKNAKRNLPLALIIGSVIVILVYVCYYIGISGALPNSELHKVGVFGAFESLFGKGIARIFTAFIAVSCIGTLNGLMLGCARGFYSIAVRGEGISPEVFSEIDRKTNMPVNSSVAGLFVCAIWLFHFYGSNLYKTPVFGMFSFDSSELPIVTVYAMYIPMFVMYIVKNRREDGAFKGIILPLMSIVAALIMIASAIYAHGIAPYMEAAENGKFSFPILFYLILFAVVMVFGRLVMNRRSKK